MEKPKILGDLNKSTIIAVILTIVSFIFPIVPCKVAPVIATPVYAWSMCKLPNPFSQNLLGISTKFWANSTEPMTGLVLQFLIVFILTTIIFMILKRKSTKVLDLTHKK
ncbi:MAG: hypothetical protein WCX73_03635 [Candidatus Pacearchaeota archaeon]|jgi:hypothetical protein